MGNAGLDVSNYGSVIWLKFFYSFIECYNIRPESGNIGTLSKQTQQEMEA